MFTEQSGTDEGVELLWAYLRMTWAGNPCSQYADGGAERGCDTQRWRSAPSAVGARMRSCRIPLEWAEGGHSVQELRHRILESDQIGNLLELERAFT